MNNKNFRLQELKRWLKTSLKNKISINDKTVITYLMLGFAGFGMIAEAGWVRDQAWADGDGSGKMAMLSGKDKAGNASVLLTTSTTYIDKNDGNRSKPTINRELRNSVVIGIGDTNERAQTNIIEVDPYASGENYAKGIVAIGSGVRVMSNPHGLGSTGNGGQAVAIGNDVTATSQSVAIGGNVYAVGGASIAIGSDDIQAYYDFKVSSYDYTKYFNALYNKIDSAHTSYGIGAGADQDKYSPNVAAGEGSISIGSRAVAYESGSTALGTLAYALGKGATALGTLSRAEGEGSIAIGNKTRNFANEALAIGNDSQILKIGGTAVGLRAKAGGEGSIAIGTDVYANTKMNNVANSQNMTQIHNTLKSREMGTTTAIIDDLERELVKAGAVSPDVEEYNGVSGIIKENGKNALVIGSKSAAIGDNALALGRGAFAMSKNSFGIGSYSYADKENSLAIGTSTRSLAEGAIVMGSGSVATNISKNSTVIGTKSGVTGENSSVVGSNSEAFSKNTLIYGNETKVGELNSTNVTDNNIAIGNSISIGSGVTNSMAYGPNSRIGDTNRATNNKIDSSTAFGSGAKIERLYSITKLTADKMTNAEAKVAADADPQFMYTGNNAMAIGNYSRAVLENSVALGVRSDTDYTYSDLLQPGWTARGSVAVPTSGQTGVISVGSKGQERRIVNVASGFRDTDAVNVIQLRTLEETVTNKVEGIESGMHYLSVNKTGSDVGTEIGSAKVTELIERRKNYDQYLRYKTQQLQLKARQAWQGEKFNEESIREIDNKVSSLEADSVIANVASTLKDYNVPTNVPSGKTAQEAYKALVNDLETINANLKSDAKYAALSGGKDIEALKLETNYSNEGGKGVDSLAIGFRASAGANAAKALAVGYKSTATGVASIANGPESRASGENAIAVGYKAIASEKNTVAIGSGTKADLEYSVALGQGVTVGKSEGKSYATNRAFADTGKVVSVGGRRINQLEDGAQDTDAVTVRQLKAMPISLKADQGSTAGEAGKVVKTDPGATVGVVSGDFNTGGNRYVGENIETFISSGNTSNPTITIGIKENPNFKTVSINNGTNSVLLSTDSSGNLNVGTKKITGVANGTSTNDAVNYSQLTASSPSLKAENAGSGISNNTLKTNNGSTIEIKSGDFNGANNVRFVGENLSTHIGGSADAPVITLGIKKEPKFKTVVLNNEASGASDLTLSSDNSGNLSVGNKKITNVADGNIAANSKEAINGGQLHTVKTTADTANTTANTAKTTAEAAKTKAEDLANKLTALGEKKLGFTVNGGTKLEKKLGETIAIEGDNSSIVTEISNGKIVAKVKDSGITEGKLASNAVTTAKIKDGAVSSGKIAAKAIDDTKLADDLKNKIDNANKVANNTILLKGDAETGTTLTTTDSVSLTKDGGISFTFEGKDGLKTKASGTKVEIGMDDTLKTKLNKLNNLDENANAKYATKEELANKASTLNIGSETTTETVNLKTDTLKVTGSGDVTVSLNNKEFTIGLSEEAKKKLDNITAKSDGRDKKDSTNPANSQSSGSFGLTKEDKLNGKDLTDKVNALRNGEAGTVVFTDAAGNRLVKANDGKYYLAKNVSDAGVPVRADDDTADPVAVDNPELRVVNSNGETTKVTTLNNIANGLKNLTNGNAAVTKDKAIEVVTALLTQTDGLNKAVNVGDLQAIAQAGLDFAGNTGTTHRALGTTLTIKGKDDVTYDDTYTTDNVATNVKEDGTVEIGFKKSPTFEKVTAKEVDAEKAKVKGDLTFDSGNGKPTTVVAGDGNGSLMINGKKVATSDSAPVLYTDADGNIVEKGLDGNIYKSEDLKGKRFDKTTKKYYADNQFNEQGNLIDNPTVAQLDIVQPETVKHALASINDGTVATPKVLSKVAKGTADTDAVNVKQLNDSYITFGGDTGTDKNVNLNNKLAIKGSDTISTEMTDAGLVIKVKEGKVDAPKIADNAVTEPKLSSELAAKINTTPVVYVNENGEKIVKGPDNKMYKPDTIKNYTYFTIKGADGNVDPAKTGFYSNADLVNGKPSETATPSQLTEYTGNTKLSLADMITGTPTSKVLTNIADGKVTAYSTEAINGKQFHAVAKNTIKLVADGEAPAVTGGARTKASTDTQEFDKNGGLSFGIKGGNGIETLAEGSNVTVRLKDEYKNKLENLDNDANNKYANKNADNINADEWKKALGLEHAVSGTGSLSIAAKTKGTATGATETSNGEATAKLDGVEKFELLGTQGITVNANDKKLTLGLDQETLDKINKVGKPSEGRDGEDGSNGHNGANGLTSKDGLNGKDLTDKVNALRNGEAGTVVFTNEAGERVVKANNGKYYKQDQLNNDGTPKTEFENAGIANPELRLVNANGETTTVATLNNLANGLKNLTNGTRAITPENAKTAIEALLKQATDLNKAVNVGDLQALAQAGLNFKGNTGDSLHKALSQELTIRGKDGADYTNQVDNPEYDPKKPASETNKAQRDEYTSDNVATRTVDGVLEIGFKHSPTFGTVTATNVYTKKIVFDLGNGKELSLDGNGDLRFGGRKLAIESSIPVVYTLDDGTKVEKARDGKYYREEDLKDKVFVLNNADHPENGGKFYNKQDTDEKTGQPLEGRTPVTLTAVETSSIKHSMLTADGSTTTPATLSNVGDAVKDNDAVNYKQLKAAGLTFGGDNAEANSKQKLESTLLVKSGDFTTGSDDTSVNYKGDNVETKYVKDAQGNGVITVGFKESPTFKNVTADNIDAKHGDFDNLKVEKVLETKEIIFKDATGSKLTLVSGKEGNLYINGVAVPTAESAPVIYTNTNGERVELGLDGKVYKPEDIKGLTYVEAKEQVGNPGETNYKPAITAGYYNDESFEKEADGKTLKKDSEGKNILKNDQTPVDLREKEYKDTVVHRLTPVNKNADPTELAKGHKLTNLANGEVSATSKDAINGAQFYTVAKNTIKLTADGEAPTTDGGERTKTSTDAKSLDTAGLSFAIKGDNGLETIASGSDVTVRLKSEYKNKLDNLDENANNKYADKDATNIGEAEATKWRNKLGLSTAVLGTVSLLLEAENKKGTTEATPSGSGSVNLTTGEKLKITGTDDVVVKAENQGFTVSLSKETSDKINNIGKVADGKDGINGKDGEKPNAAQNGLTGQDGLNGKDLTTKVNALRNGEAGTVVFTDGSGNRLVKANDGNYYLVANVNENGTLKDGITEANKVENPELRVVNSNGETTKVTTLNNIANGLKDLTNANAAVTKDKAIEVVKNLLTQTDGLNKAVNVGDLQAIAQAGLDFAGNTGEATHRALGTTLTIKGKEGANYDDTYTSDNIATKVTDGNIEIGFKKSPTFETVTAKEVDAEKAKVKGELTFDSGNGKPTTVVAGDGNGSLMINGKKVATSDSAPVLYTDADGNIVEKGLDGNIYKSEDLKGKRFDKTTKKYYADNQFNEQGNLIDNPTVAQLDIVQPETVKHALASINDGTVATPKVLSKVAKGTADTDAVNVKQLKDSHITFGGDTGTDKNVKLSEKLAIKGSDTISTEMTNEGLVIKVKEGKVDAPKIADQAVTSAKLAQDARTVVYVTSDNKPVELGADGKLHKSEDLQGKTYIVSKDPAITSGYYADSDLNPDKTAPIDNTKAPVTIEEVVSTTANPLRHALNGYIAGGTDVTTKSVLTNVGAGAIADNSTDAINGSQIKNVLDKMGVEIDSATGKIKEPTITAIKGADGTDGATPTTLKDGLNNVISKVNEGLKYNGDLGTENTQQLGSKLTVNKAGSELTEQDTPTVKYVGSNLITKYTKDSDGNGKIEIGFKESPTFKDVTSDSLTTKTLTFDDGKGNKLKVGPTTDGTALKIGEKEIATKEDVILKLSKDGLADNGKVDLSSQKLHVAGSDGISVDISANKIDVKLDATTKSKLDNLDANASTKYANKDASNLNDLTEEQKNAWKAAIGLENAVSGTGSLSIEAFTKGTAADATETSKGTATVKLDGIEKFKLLGTQGITVTGSAEDGNKTLTFGLDEETVKKINKVGAPSEGRDGLDGSNGHNGANGLTAKDGLNGKDLTDKVNAIRNGEAGTVVFTDSEGNRLVKANDGNYYKAEKVDDKGNLKDESDKIKKASNGKYYAANKVDATGNLTDPNAQPVDYDPELRVVNEDGSTTLANKLSNIADGKINENSKDAINGSQIKKLLDKLGVKTDPNTGEIKQPEITAIKGADGTDGATPTTLKDGLNSVIAKVNEGIKYNGDLGEEGAQQLGTVFNVNKAENTLTKDDVNYVGNNIITKYTKDSNGNGKLEIGFKESPTFKNVKAENIEAIDGKFKDLKVTEKIVTKEIEFKDGTGNNLTLVSGKDGNLYINGVAVPSAANAPVIYTNTNGERVELGQDGNVYKPQDLEGLTYVKARAAEGAEGTPGYKPAITAGYYNNDTMFKKNSEGVIEKDADGNKILVDNATPTDLTAKVYGGKVVHRLSPIKKDDTEARLLTNLANGDVSATSKDAINGAQLYELQEKPITFKGDTEADQVTRKLGETLNITGDGVKVSKNANGDGFVLSIDQGKVQTKNVADEAVTSAKLAKDARTVVYIDADGDPVELGADGKLHKAKDLKDKTYIESKDPAIASGYYNNTDLNAERTKPNTGAQVVTVAETTPVKHALNGYTNDKLDTNTKSVLTNVGNGKIAADSTDAINGTQMKSVVDAIGATLDAEGKTITLPTITTVTGKVAPTNIVDGLNKSIEVINSGLNFAGDTGNDNQLLGSTLNVKTGDFDITKDDTTVNYKGINIETKYEKGTDGNGTITVGITDKPKFKKVSTEELELIDSKNADNKATIKVDGDKVKVNDKEIATKDEVTSVTANSIKLTANGTTTATGVTENNETDTQLLNKAGGLSFGILGSEGLITTANGNNITVKLDETTKAKLENITAVADGKDGLKGDTGNTGAIGAMGEKGLTGNDGLNGKDLTTKVNALRDGEAGTVVFTDETGNRVVKAKDGKYYLAKNVNAQGEVVKADGETTDPVAVNNPQLRTVNSDGTTTTPVTLNNVASALGLDSTLAKAIEEADAKNKVGTLLSEANKDNLNKVVTVRDLQALAQAGLDFTGNAGTVHRTLGSVLKIVGKEVTGFTADKFTENFSTENVATNVKADGTVEIGISKKVKFEEVDGDKVKAKELVLKPQDETKADLTIKTDGEGNLVVGDKKITAGDITLSLKGKTIDSKNVETTTGNGETDKVNLSNGEKLEVIAKNGVTVEIQGKDITLGLDQSTQDKLKNITSVSDGKDGKDAKDPTNGANGNHGLTANDGLNGKDLTAKVNALRNGEAGTVVFTDGEGHRLVKANNGKYYLVEKVKEDGNLVDGTDETTGLDNPELRVVNANGETIKPTVLNNIANGLTGLDSKVTDKPVSEEKAKGVVTTLLTQTDGLNKAVNVGDLQAIAQAGLNFTGNTGSVHSPLSTTLNIAGQGSPSADFVGASGNIKVEATQGTEDRISKLEIQLAEALKGIKSIQNEDTKITLDKDNGVAITGKDGGKVVVKDKDGNDKVTIKGGTDTESPSIEFAKKTDGDTTTGTGTITGLKDPEIDTTTNKPKDPTAATTVNYVTNQIEGAKTEITKNIKNIVDGGMKYTGNDNVEVTVKLNEGLNIKGEGDYTGENSATGNIAVTGNNTTSTLEIKLNKNLKNIETISNGDTKITLAKDGISVSGKDGNSTVAINGGNGTNGASISVNGKDGKDGVTIKGTDGTNGSSIVVNGKDGKPGVTINGGNGTNGKDATISFTKEGDKGTGSITGLKDPEFNEDGTPKDPTAATTVNYVTNEIKNVTNTINNAVNKMDKGLNFVGNDGESVNAKLDGTVSITGEGTIATGTNTAANNIKVEKDSTEGKTGLVVKLADKLTGMTGFETKVEDGKKVTIDKDGIKFNKDEAGKGTGVITGLKDDEKDSTSAVTRGTYNTFVTEVTNKLNKVSTIKYSDSKGEHSVAPDTGFTFKGDGNITTVAKEDGVVEFNLNKHIDLSSKSELGTITGVKTKEDDATSVATVNYVESKMGDSVKVANKALVGVANAVAMANLPQVNNVGNNRNVISAAYGNYEGQNALALGISGVNKERTLIYKGSAALNTSGKVALGVGIGYQFGTDKHDEIKESETVKALKEEVIALKSKDDKNTTIISELKEEMKRKDIENEYKTHRLEEENKEIKSYIEELRKENEKTREALERLLEAFKAKEEK